MSKPAKIAPQPPQNTRLRPRFWERVPLKQLNPAEWEALCDGCGKCCLNKLEDEETGQVGQYDIRHQFVPECVRLSPDNISEIAYWMPASCAYRRIYEGKPLYDWHPLVSGRAQSVHEAGASVRGWTIPEFEIPVEEWEDYIIEESL